MGKIGFRLAALAMLNGLPGCGDSTSSPPQPGIYHLDIASEYAANVEIHPKGTFRWGAGGCDVGYAGDGGQWRRSGDRLVLLPAGDSTTFVWITPFSPGHGGITHDVYEQLDIVAGPREGELAISGIGERSGYASYAWLAGGVCPTSCGSPTTPCADPYTGSCFGNTPPAYCHPDP